MSMKPLFIPLKTEYYESFCDGSKDTEYRPYGPRWNENTCWPGRPVVISKGYGKQNRRTGVIRHFYKSMEPTQTKAWQDCYPDRSEQAACIVIDLD